MQKTEKTENAREREFVLSVLGETFHQKPNERTVERIAAELARLVALEDFEPEKKRA